MNKAELQEITLRTYRNSTAALMVEATQTLDTEKLVELLVFISTGAEMHLSFLHVTEEHIEAARELYRKASAIALDKTTTERVECFNGIDIGSSDEDTEGIRERSKSVVYTKTIHRCNHCPNYHITTLGGAIAITPYCWGCEPKPRELASDEIPNWCPLLENGDSYE